MMESNNVAAGWYEYGEGQQAYWDGERWASPPTPKEAQPLDQPGKATWVGYLMAILFPVVGVIGAIIQFARGNVGPGMALLVLSALSFVVWFAVLASVAVNDYQSCVDQAQTFREQLACAD
jgi:hypothetical protein